MIIAEIGWNFLGDINLAEKMIIEASKSGATHAKFQYWSVANLKPGQWDNDGRRDIYKSAELNDKMINALNKISHNNNLTPFYSVFSIDGLIKLNSLGLKIIKIPSHEIYNLKLIEKAFELFDVVILSTGACYENEIIEVANLSKNYKGSLEVMHCVSSYPCNIDNMNLPRIEYLAKLFPTATLGISDHSSSLILPAISVPFGVTTLEKHFTIDHNLPGRDNKFAVLPDEFKQMVTYFNDAISACQFKGVSAQDCESDIIKNYRGRWSKVSK